MQRRFRKCPAGLDAFGYEDQFVFGGTVIPLSRHVRMLRAHGYLSTESTGWWNEGRKATLPWCAYFVLERNTFFMLWTIFVILLIMWLLGFSLHVAGSLVHLLLVVALIVLVVNLISGRRTVV
jgi:hypothetical protein